ncbi:two component transcriptional regulator, LuxR family [Plantibacter flavus]|uniref:LuxR family two component transcriptional regulator n=1 Tax=Plantibacter flavus TaxID=150123 RepID=A0A3N2C706_9MICO|nr:response regulator transcription factor [Plantibacter flavus]ROR83303.1 LuxR family two component transcriptional regulator [Plantibacter flavus]SMG22397.1 two component transcriptional regulator, LuxR family [Plantibacter flavus]
MTTVLVVDDQSLIRQAVADILSSEADLEVVGEAVDGAQAVSLARELRPDVVLMDIRMPVLDGIGATSAICADPDLADTRVLILTTFEEDENLIATLRAGASGFIGKGSEPEEIVRAVRAVHAGDALLSPAATQSLITKYVVAADEATSSRQVPTELALLTERELEVLLLVARGRSNQQIADDLVISPHTSKTHVNRIMTKVAAHDRAQLVILAYESGLLRPGADD